MHKIAVIAFEGISLFHLSIPSIVFGDKLLKLGAPRYDIVFCTETPGIINTLSNVSMNIIHDLSAVDKADTVIIPAWSSPSDKPSIQLISTIKKAYNEKKRIVGQCLGAFVLAESGIPDNKRASTHWAWANEFRTKYPKVILDEKTIYVKEQNIMTSAGTAAAIDCCIDIIRHDLGAEIANKIARRLVVAPHRHGDQSQYIETPIYKNGETNRFTNALDWAISNINTGITLKKMAEKSSMSVRSFTRHFTKKNGTTFTQWLLNQKLHLAQRLLEQSEKSIEVIAYEAGFLSVITFRQHFTKTFSISPRLYRKQFIAKRIDS